MTVYELLSVIAALFCGGLAVSVFLKGRHSFVHLVFAAGMLAFAAEAVLNGLSFRAVLSGLEQYDSGPTEIAKWQNLRLLATALVPVAWLLFSLSFGRVNYREIIRKWRYYILALLILPLGLLILFGQAFFQGPPSHDVAAHWAIPLGWSGYFFFVFSLLGAVLIIMNLERTLRNSSGSIRWQIKFMVLGLGGIFAVRVYTGSQVLLFHSLEMGLEAINTGVLFVGGGLIIWSLLRLRLLSVEIYPSHSFLFSSITVVIMGIYLVAVGVLAKVVSYLNISNSFLIEALLIFLSCLGLTVILLSNKLRQGIRRFVSLHLKRPKYDYRATWRTFAHRTASLIDIKEVCAAVTKMAGETFGVPCVTVWLADESKENLLLGGSTVLSSADLKGPLTDKRAAREFIKAMQNQEVPIDLEGTEKDWIMELKRSHSKYLRDARVRYAVSLVSGNEFLGIMTLNENLTKDDFTIEDFDLLKTIADQAAGAILNIRMSQQLSRSREMEAFQTMSAFFIHDLKNLASKLSLTMQNLPTHYDNPEFRHDALRAIADSVNKMNTLCGGLSLLRQKVVLQPVEVDLNKVVASTLATLNGCKASISSHLNPLPEILADPEQIQKVITNLVLNANEAVGDGGSIRVTTEQRDDRVVLCVSDNGCGMPKEFIENSLFRPFKTTKKQGMGIGLYHCKMIVEGHQGRIEVESEEGQGTTIKVMLPVK